MPHKTANKYSRVARLYDLIEWPVEALLFHRLRAEAVSHIEGDALELGVGTGKNLPYYPSGQNLTVIDFSPGMLRHAQQKLTTRPLQHAKLMEMDVQAMHFLELPHLQGTTFDHLFLSLFGHGVV